jgi:hypothetical protein
MQRITIFKVYYFMRLCWQSYNSQSLQRLEVERAVLGIPFSLSFRLNKIRLYVLRSAHVQNKAAECLESCIWLGRGQSFCFLSVIGFLESHLNFNEGTLLHKLICYLEFSRFISFKLFFFLY